MSVKDAGLTLAGIDAKVGPLTRAFQSFVHVTFNNAPQQLAPDFEQLQPPKVRTPLTVEQKARSRHGEDAGPRVQRVGRAGRKQKLAVKGDVTSVTIMRPSEQPTVSSQPATLWRGSLRRCTASSGPTK